MRPEIAIPRRPAEFIVNHRKVLSRVLGLLFIAGMATALGGAYDASSAQDKRFEIFNRKEIIKEVNPNSPSLLSQQELDEQMFSFRNRQKWDILIISASGVGAMVGGLAWMATNKLELQNGTKQ